MKRIVFPILAVALLMLAGCTSHPSLPEAYTQTDSLPKIFPDYTHVTIPCNIAPLNFMVEDAEECIALIKWENESATYGKKNKVQIPTDEWAEMLAQSKGKSLSVELYTREEGKEWLKHSAFPIHVAADAIDPYISYRLICPSYIAYEMLTINQRNLENFEETVIYNNMLVSNEKGGQCINCHSYQNYRTDNMQFHMRQAYGGTMIVSDGKARKVNLKTSELISAGVYPSWHPTKKFIAYSTNLTGQSFHTKSLAKIEVLDSRSDLILYDIEKNEVSNISAEIDEMETFPWWNPTGDTLYYTSAHFDYSSNIEDPEVDALSRYQEIKYNIYRRAFNAEDKSFGEAELVYDAAAIGQSATLPRISPCGRYLLFAQGEWGCFHIWHPDADLHLIDLSTGKARKLENVNSSQSESYHSWSSNGRWMVFSSRRMDGNFTRLYIAYFDQEGQAHKAFVIPQEDPSFYSEYLRSYNISEFMVEPVSISPHEFAAAAKKEAVQATFAE